MRYPVVIEPGNDESAYGVVVPDLPGCFSAGDSLDEALVQAQQAVGAWIDAALDAGTDNPAPTPLEQLRSRNKAWKNWVWALVEVDPAALDDTPERVNISLPRRVLRRLDNLARSHGETRSGFIARMALAQSTAA